MRRLCPALALLSFLRLSAATVEVRHAEGVVHGFLALRSTDGRTLADGDLVQTSRGDEVTARLVFHFRDGSLQEETTVFTERGTFRLVRYHLVQKGPSFPRETDLALDTRSGRVTVRSVAGGKESAYDETMALPDDLANGLALTLLKNLAPGTARAWVSMVVAAPKPTLVHLRVTPQGEHSFAIGASPRKAIRWAVAIEIPGVKGVLAKLFGKVPPDTHVLVLPGQAPAFLRSEGPAFPGGPVWRIELTSPTWPEEPKAAK